VVASAVGVQREQVRDGTTGRLARSDDEFRQALEALLSDREARRRMGEAAREDVRRRWSVESWAPRVVEEVERLLR
jgi:glycosyltransferase involved in cell wall biosynthesis